jgi:hypothetical protein
MCSRDLEREIGIEPATFNLGIDCELQIENISALILRDRTRGFCEVNPEERSLEK